MQYTVAACESVNDSNLKPQLKLWDITRKIYGIMIGILENILFKYVSKVKVAVSSKSSKKLKRRLGYRQ